MRRVLVVDDSATVRRYHGSILRDAGFEVVEAANGYEALERSIEEEFDLILVDLNMPRLDGAGLVTLLRREGPNRQTPIIMVSVHRPERGGGGATATATGIDLFLTKPVDPDGLVSVAMSLMGSRAS